MVHTSSFDSNLSLWNIEGRAQMGSQGDDVRLIQYLLARAPEAANYVPDKISGSSGISVGDVDGSWGAQTDAAQKWLEQNWKANHSVVADGVIDVIPPTGVFFGPDSSCEYKLAVLQWLYAVACNQGTNYLIGSPSVVIMDMATDGQCPSDLAYALQAAKNNAQSADGGGGSDGSDGN